MNVNIRDGQFWEVDSDGFLQNNADFLKIKPDFKKVKQDVKQAYLENLSPALHSCYLTGSIPRGTAVPGFSDLDAFAVLKEGFSADDHLSWITQVKAQLLNQHSEVTDIQMEVWEWNDIFGVPRNYLSEFQVILKLNSVCCYGEDLSQEILSIKPDVALANTEMIQLKPDIEEALAKLARDKRPEHVQFWCKKIMKNLIRAGFYMVIPNEKAFSRDLSL